MKKVTLYGSYDFSTWGYRIEFSLPINSPKFDEPPIFSLSFDDANMDSAFKNLDDGLKRKLAFMVKDAVEAGLNYSEQEGTD